MKGAPVLTSLIFGIFTLCAAIPVQRLQPSGQGLMYMQYTQPEPFERNARQSNRVFVAAGNSVVAGSYVEDENNFAQTTNVDGIENSEDAISSVAESVDFPDKENTAFQSKQDFIDPVQVNEVQTRISEDEERNVEVTTNADEVATTISYSDVNAQKVPILLVALANKPLPRVLPKQQKKFFVELDTSQPDSLYSPVTPRIIANNKKAAGVRPDSNAARPIASSPNGSFFPIDFGTADGGVIAIANSFSTGEGGSATSTATAYGRSNEFTYSTGVRSG